MGVVERGPSAAWTLGRFWGASQSFSDSGTRWRAANGRRGAGSVESGRTKGGSVWGERRGSGQRKAAARGRVQRAGAEGAAPAGAEAESCLEIADTRGVTRRAPGWACKATAGWIGQHARRSIELIAALAVAAARPPNVADPRARGLGRSARSGRRVVTLEGRVALLLLPVGAFQAQPSLAAVA